MTIRLCSEPAPPKLVQPVCPGDRDVVGIDDHEAATRPEQAVPFGEGRGWVHQGSDEVAGYQNVIAAVGLACMLDIAQEEADRQIPRPCLGLGAQAWLR